MTGRAWIDAALGLVVAIGAYFLGVRHERARWVARARIAFKHRTHVGDGDTT